LKCALFTNLVCATDLPDQFEKVQRSSVRIGEVDDAVYATIADGGVVYADAALASCLALVQKSTARCVLETMTMRVMRALELVLRRRIMYAS